jgi:hypothetical protein
MIEQLLQVGLMCWTSGPESWDGCQYPWRYLLSLQSCFLKGKAHGGMADEGMEDLIRQDA